MAELLDRLQSAVGDAYRLEHELGGGGMSRVFVATEVRLGRQVVIKVLPPEMAAGVSVERFEREILVAAKLQHPHVVSLLTTGSHDDLLYYVMPFIEGESLRAKLVREGELPIGEVLSILREVADALGYAHRHGVVHRDIKPDNILLADGHALVTDFGVAKAVNESTGSQTLTSMGVALGTPTYMSPEQAAANPHVDHRSDIYSLGTLAYEMLCGRPPFEGGTPQAMLAAHVTQTPDPVTTHRSTVPAAMNDLVMRCLAKLPADRYQTADELKQQLVAMTTPSGGVTPTGTQPVVSSGTEAAIRRAHPVRVAGLFGLASVGALALVYLLVIQLGLPNWVMFGAAALLAEGRFEDAIAAFQAWHDAGDGFCGYCSLPRLAEAYESAGEPDSALAVYERAANADQLFGMYEWGAVMAPTYKRVGELYEERSDRDKAVEYYNRFVELWQNADAELQPQVEDVRGRIARLVGEGR